MAFTNQTKKKRLLRHGGQKGQTAPFVCWRRVTERKVIVGDWTCYIFMRCHRSVWNIWAAGESLRRGLARLSSKWQATLDPCDPQQPAQTNTPRFNKQKGAANKVLFENFMQTHTRHRESWSIINLSSSHAMFLKCNCSWFLIKIKWAVSDSKLEMIDGSSNIEENFISKI